jgi:hypothetical protein
MTLYKDQGGRGSWAGDVDTGFVDDTFECEEGVYRVASSEEQAGGWKAGERHGKGSSTSADGIVEYATCEKSYEQLRMMEKKILLLIDEMKNLAAELKAREGIKPSDVRHIAPRSAEMVALVEMPCTRVIKANPNTHQLRGGTRSAEYQKKSN